MKLIHKITGCILAFLLCSSFAYGQRSISIPFTGNYDEDAPVLLGLSFPSVGLSHYALELSKNWVGSDILPNGEGKDHILDLENIRSITSKPSFELSVGLAIDIKLNDLLYVHATPSFNFINGTHINYSGETSNSEEKSIQRRGRHTSNTLAGRNFNNINFPFNIKYRSEEKVVKGRGWDFRYRGYLLGGARYTRWAGIEKEYRELRAEVERGIKYQGLVFHKGYSSWEAGIGVDLFFKYFKFSPNIKYVQSFSNVFDNSSDLWKDNLFMDPIIQSGKVKSVFLTLIFQ